MQWHHWSWRTHELKLVRIVMACIEMASKACRENMTYLERVF